MGRSWAPFVSSLVEGISRITIFQSQCICIFFSTLGLVNIKSEWIIFCSGGYKQASRSDVSLVISYLSTIEKYGNKHKEYLILHRSCNPQRIRANIMHKTGGSRAP